MERVVETLFNVYAGEQKQAFRLALLAFLWSLGAYCGQILFDGLFLEHVGASALPAAYLATSLTVFAVAAAILKLLNRVAVATIFCWALGLMALFFVGAIIAAKAGLLEGHGTWPWLVLKFMTSSFCIILYTCFWAFVDQFHDLHNAKRLYCLFGSAMFLGDAVGGAFISLGLQQLKLSGMLLTLTVVLLLCLWGARSLMARMPTPPPPTSEDGVTTRHTIRTFLRTVILSPFTLLLMVAYMLAELLRMVTQYNYMKSFETYFDAARFVGDDNALTVFLGECIFWISLGNIVFGLFFYSRVVKGMGINNLILMCPLFFVGTFMTWSVVDFLIIAVCGLVAVEGLSETLDDNNFNVLVNAVPSGIKDRIRVITGSFFEPIGMLLSAGLMMLFQTGSQWLGLILALITLGVICLLRRSYRKTVRLQAHLFEEAAPARKVEGKEQRTEELEVTLSS